MIGTYIRCLIGLNLIVIFILLIRKTIGSKLQKKFIYGLWIMVPLFLMIFPFIKLPRNIGLLPDLADIIRMEKDDIQEVGTLHEVNDSQEMNASQDKSDTQGISTMPKVSATEKVEQTGFGKANKQSMEEQDVVYGIPQNEAVKDFQTVYKQQRVLETTNGVKTESNVRQAAKNLPLKEILMILYFAIAAGMIFSIMAVNLRFSASCKRRRRYLFQSQNAGLSVYHLDGISSPFLNGRTIYLPSYMNEEEQIRYAILHEEGHYRHGDSIWVIVRYLILAVFFYDPIIWLAFYVSGRDCELACDEEVLQRISAKERKEYGICLLRIVEHKLYLTDRMIMTTNMSTGKGFMKERIQNIMDRKRKSILAMILSASMLLAVTGCALERQSSSDLQDGSVATQNENLKDDIFSEFTKETVDEDTQKEVYSRPMTDEEIHQISDWASDIENYGFFLSSYQDPKDADYKEVLYSGARINSCDEYTRDELNDEWIRVTGVGLSYDPFVFKRQELNEFLQRKVGLGIDDIELDLPYSSNLDAYIWQLSDTNITDHRCSEGKVTIDDKGEQILTCKFYQPEFGVYTASLRKVGDDYQILSCVFERPHESFSQVFEKDRKELEQRNSQKGTDRKEQTTSRPLTEEEINFISEWTSRADNCGFFCSNYADPKDADYSFVFCIDSCIDSHHEYSEQELQDDYIRCVRKECADKGVEFDEEHVLWNLNLDMCILRKNDINEFLKKKVGLGIEDTNFDWNKYVYSPTHDAYYNCTGAFFEASYKCLEGIVTLNENGDEIYTVKLKSPLGVLDYEPDVYPVVTLKKVGDDFQILSCLYEPSFSFDDSL